MLALSRVLSEGGMLLGNSTSPLPPDTEIDLHIQFTDSREPLQIRGRVLAITRRGTRVQFVPGQTAQVARLRKFIVGKIIPTLINELKRPDVNLRRVCELAELYVDYGRQADALQLYRETLLKRGFDRMVCENMARAYIDQLQTATGDVRSRLIYELNDLCQRSLKDLPDSEILGVGRQLVQAHSAPPPLRSGAVVQANQAVPNGEVVPAGNQAVPGGTVHGAPPQITQSNTPAAAGPPAPGGAAPTVPSAASVPPTARAPAASAPPTARAPVPAASAPPTARAPVPAAAAVPAPPSYPALAPPHATATAQAAAPPAGNGQAAATDKTRLAAYSQAVQFAAEYQDAELNAVRDSMHLLHRRVQDLDAERRALLDQLQSVRSELARERAESAREVRAAYEEKGLRAVRAVPLDEDEESALGVLQADTMAQGQHTWQAGAADAEGDDERLHRRQR